MVSALYLVAATGAPSMLPELAALLIASAVIAYICSRLGILPLVGFLVAGVVIGPKGLGLVRDSDLIDTAAEIGVMLLLFTVGIEFSLERLARIKRAIFLGGGLQMLFTISAAAGLLSLLGMNWRTGIFTGSLIALSSTAIVMKVLGDANDTTTPRGQLALGILIFQDLAIVALVLLIPVLAGDVRSPLPILRNLGLAVLIIGMVIVVARRVMPAVLERVARTCSSEVFILSVIAICMGTAWLTSLAGVTLSLGAFLAGLVVSESRFSHHAFSEILPLQILFSAVFFVSVGLLLDLEFVFANPLIIAGVVVGVLALKLVTGTASGWLLRYPLGTATAAALLIGQIGEFSFVLERAGRDAGLQAGGTEGGAQIFIAVTVLLMGVSPLLARAGSAVESRFADRAAAPRLSPETATRVDLENHVIVAGYGSAARYLTRVLRDSGVPFVILTLSPTGASEAENEQLHVLLGDYSRRAILELGAIDRAKMLVVPDDAADMARRVTGVARAINPTLRIVVRAYANADVEELMAAGADDVLVDELEIGIQLFTSVLGDYRVPSHEIEDHVATVRAGGYAALRSGIRDVALVVCDGLDDECFDTRTFTVREGAAATRMNAAEFARKGGIRVMAIERGAERFEPPPPELTLGSGDRVTARASAEAFVAAAVLLRGSSVERDDETSPAARVITLDPEQQKASGCKHIGMVEREVTTTATGCEDCLRIGDTWVELRICMSCGGVRCCDSSKNRHATHHFESTAHPIIKSYQPGENWAWCYPDKINF